MCSSHKAHVFRGVGGGTPQDTAALTKVSFPTSLHDWPTYLLFFTSWLIYLLTDPHRGLFTNGLHAKWRLSSRFSLSRRGEHIGDMMKQIKDIKNHFSFWRVEAWSDRPTTRHKSRYIKLTMLDFLHSLSDDAEGDGWAKTFVYRSLYMFNALLWDE